MLFVAVCCGSLRFVAVPCGSLRFVAVRCGSVRCGSVHVRFVAMSGSFRFGSLAVRFIPVRFVRFVVLLAVRFGSRRFGSVHAVRFGSAAILNVDDMAHILHQKCGEKYDEKGRSHKNNLLEQKLWADAWANNDTEQVYVQ